MSLACNVLLFLWLGHLDYFKNIIFFIRLLVVVLCYISCIKSFLFFFIFLIMMSFHLFFFFLRVLRFLLESVFFKVFLFDNIVFD